MHQNVFPTGRVIPAAIVFPFRLSHFVGQVDLGGNLRVNYHL